MAITRAQQAKQLLALGGRIGLQEGGGIEQRLEQLGGDVTSAEQMLQGINQRLKTAESSLGGGGVEELQAVRPSGGLAEIANNLDTFPGNPNRPIQLPGIRPDFSATIDPNFKPVEELKAVQPGDPGYRAPGPTTLNGVVIDNPLLTESRERIFNNIPEEYRAGFAEFAKGRPIGFGGQAISYVGLPSGDRVMFGDTGSAGTFRDYLSSIGFTPPGPQVAQLPAQGSLGIPAAGYADGGNVVGGEFDFESARQMYGLGKLVKKVTKTVKKIAKSPIGKAALLYGAGSLGMAGLGQFRAGTGIFSPTGFLKSKALPFLVGKAAPLASMPGTSRQFVMGPATKGILGAAGKFSPFKVITAASLLPFAGLGTGEETEEEAKAILDQSGLDIDAIRESYLAEDQYRARRFKAEGGSIKEPVAKKTMPLLDMGGQEMDLRAEGGFVPIGRMEKADDVPARLSKNEFVFTADAVRNAGDGNVDKGAEVMYNMMKNLEAGGEVSEESQGLEGARRMFQTSKRLEEVL